MITVIKEKEKTEKLRAGYEKAFQPLLEKPLLEIKNLSKRFKDVLALDRVSFSVRKGEFIAIIGPSGSGKTTLIRCINRLIDASEGAVLFEDVDLLALRSQQLRRTRAKIGMVFQHYNLVYRLSVIENVLHGRLGYKSDFEGLLGIYSNQEKERAVEILDLLGLNEHVYKRCDQLSGGQKQRVGIARALVQNPRLILCDEPISSLDPSSAKIIMDYLRKIQKDLGITIIVNLHQVDVAKKYAGRILGIRAGQLVFDGPPQDLSHETIHEIYGTEAGELIID